MSSSSLFLSSEFPSSLLIESEFNSLTIEQLLRKQLETQINLIKEKSNQAIEQLKLDYKQKQNEFMEKVTESQ